MIRGTFIRTEEMRKNMSLAKLGTIHSEETKRKIGDSNRGKKHSETTRKKMSESAKGRNPTKETRRKMSETRKRISFEGRHKPKYHTEETKQKIRDARLKQILPVIDTSIERKFEIFLKEKSINYIHPFNLGNRFQCDFYLPSLNLIVECDGTYWHSRPDMKKRDKAKDAYAKKCGFNMLRLAEKQINKGRYFNFIKELQQ